MNPRQAAKDSGRKDSCDMDKLAVFFHAPLHRSRIRWFVLTSYLDVFTRLSGLLLVHSLGQREVFSWQLAEVRTVFSWTQLSRTHTLMSYPETVFEDLRKPKE